MKLDKTKIMKYAGAAILTTVLSAGIISITVETNKQAEEPKTPSYTIEENKIVTNDGKEYTVAEREGYTFENGTYKKETTVQNGEVITTYNEDGTVTYTAQPGYILVGNKCHKIEIGVEDFSKTLK